MMRVHSRVSTDAGSPTVELLNSCAKTFASEDGTRSSLLVILRGCKKLAETALSKLAAVHFAFPLLSIAKARSWKASLEIMGVVSGSAYGVEAPSLLMNSEVR
jgi:hypothetical protein